MQMIPPGMSRRHFLRHMTTASMTIPMAGWLNSAMAARQAATAAGKRPHSLILMWMGGGPATIDIWDLKPGSKNGGEFKPIDTSVPGMQITEHLPKTAQIMHHLNLIRSYNSRDGAHERGTYINHTGFAPVPSVMHPAIGAVAAKFNGPESLEVPGHISLGGPGVSPGFLGTSYAPFRVEANSQNPIPNLNPVVEDDRFARRRQLLAASTETMLRERKGHLPDDQKIIYDKAFHLMGSSVLDAFNINGADEQANRERYGDSTFGKQCLMARRLIEMAQVPFIEIGFGGWDMHQGIWEALAGTGGMMGGGARAGGMSKLAQMDAGIASLVQDLVERGLWETTTLVWMGDFGRTPRINQDGGRDHWPGSWSVMLGGGKMKGGQVVGKLDDDGVAIVDRPVDVSNLFATLYKAIDIDPATELRSPNGRPIKLVGIFGDGNPVNELF